MRKRKDYFDYIAYHREKRSGENYSIVVPDECSDTGAMEDRPCVSVQ